MGGPVTVQWRGVRVDPRTRDMLNEVARLTPGLPTLQPSQGSYSTSVSASAGTHAGGGAVDISASNLTSAQEIETVRVMRTVGFAAWRRTPSDGPWPTHIHGIAIGCKDLSPAAAKQVDAYKAGRNGLANNGPDPHRDLGVPYTTWETYKQEAHMALDQDDAYQLWRYKGKKRDAKRDAWAELRRSGDNAAAAASRTATLVSGQAALRAAIADLAKAVASQKGIDPEAFAKQVQASAEAGAAAALQQMIDDARVELVIGGQ